MEQTLNIYCTAVDLSKSLVHCMAIIVATSYAVRATSQPLRMQLVRTAQSKHKINLLALSTENGGSCVVATSYVILIVCSSCVPLNPNTNTSSHSPRRTGGPQAPASGALVESTAVQRCARKSTGFSSGLKIVGENRGDGKLLNGAPFSYRNRTPHLYEIFCYGSSYGY